MRTITLALALTLGAVAHAQEPKKPFAAISGQAGKDVVWVPSTPGMVNKMLAMAKVTPGDFVMDRGSGDGRNVIAAAKLGARALGVEFNPDMVALSRKLAAEAGVTDKAQFIEGDLYAADISKANVLALFLLPVNLNGSITTDDGTHALGEGAVPWQATRQIMIARALPSQP